jgi:ribosome recycling factor
MSFSFVQFQEKLDKALAHVTQEVGLLRTGRASVQMLDSVRVEAYGTMLKLNEVANVSAPDANMLTVKPWDPGLLAAIEKGIASSGLNLQPVVDKDMIRIVVPALTEERRLEMVKLLGQKVEQGRVMLRTIRTDIKKEVENQEGEDGISEDDIKLDLAEMEKVFKASMDQLDTIEKDKSAELMKV